MVAQKNIINKVQIGVNTTSLANGMQLKDSLIDFFKEEVFPELDDYFNSIQKNNTNNFRFDKVSIEIDINENDSLKNLKQLIVSKLKKIINSENISDSKSEKFKKTTSEKSEIEAFFYFLEHGILPWWFEEKPAFGNAFFEKLERQKSFSKTLKKLLSKQQVRKRLVYQFNDKQLISLVSAAFNISNSENITPKIPLNYRNLFWESVLHFSAFKNEKDVVDIFENTPFKDVEKLLNISNKIFGLEISISKEDFQKVETKNQTPSDFESTIDYEKKMNFENSPEIKKMINDGVLVKNAGLILLHPFLKMFFEKLNFLSEKQIKPEAIDESIHLLHYLATGREQPFEHELAFEKFLCNVPLHQAVNRHLFLTKTQKLACEILLEAVLDHWTALKSNSTEMLQNEFLQREGKLTVSDEKQNLYIQRKTQDLLLDRLPWNTHLVKLPWKEKILFVEW